MNINLASPDAASILLVCLVVLLPGTLLVRYLRVRFSTWEFVVTVTAGILFSLLSLYYRTAEHWAGSRKTHEAGWPHSFYDENVGFFPSFLPYFLIDVLFYSSILFFGLMLIKCTVGIWKRRNPTTLSGRG